jgi:hypothetical protein
MFPGCFLVSRNEWKHVSKFTGMGGNMFPLCFCVSKMIVSIMSFRCFFVSVSMRCFHVSMFPRFIVSKCVSAFPTTPIAAQNSVVLNSVLWVQNRSFHCTHLEHEHIVHKIVILVKWVRDDILLCLDIRDSVDGPQSLV